MVLIKNLYIVFARATGLWFISIEGFVSILLIKIIRLVFHEFGIFCCLQLCWNRRNSRLWN